MSKTGRQLQPGDMCQTNFSGKVTQHKIVKRTDGSSQSGVMFTVEPVVPKSSGGWIDAYWFVPLNNKK